MAMSDDLKGFLVVGTFSLVAAALIVAALLWSTVDMRRCRERLAASTCDTGAIARICDGAR